MLTYIIVFCTLFVILACINILLNTEMPSKALRYLLVVSFPIVGAHPTSFSNGKKLFYLLSQGIEQQNMNMKLIYSSLNISNNP